MAKNIKQKMRERTNRKAWAPRISGGEERAALGQNQVDLQPGGLTCSQTGSFSLCIAQNFSVLSLAALKWTRSLGANLRTKSRNPPAPDLPFYFPPQTSKDEYLTGTGGVGTGGTGNLGFYHRLFCSLHIRLVGDYRTPGPAVK